MLKMWTLLFVPKMFHIQELFFKLDEKIVRVVNHSVDARKIYGTCGQVFQIIDNRTVICCGDGTAIQISKVLIDGKVVDASHILNSIKIRLS